MNFRFLFVWLLKAFVFHFKWKNHSSDFYKTESEGRPTTLADTGVQEPVLRQVCHASCSYPAQFNIHAGLAKFLRLRREMVDRRQADWALGEAMAFGSLLAAGVHVRLSGQDSERGAFSHRHYVLHDQKVDKQVYVPMNNIAPGQVIAQFVFLAMFHFSFKESLT